MTGDDDWRLMGQDVWLSGRALRWSPWVPYRTGWDHDHCAFCQAKIAAVEATFTAGYVTADDGYTWICVPCVEDFRHQFGWRIQAAPE